MTHTHTLLIDGINENRSAVSTHALEVLSYAFKHGYAEIIDEAAPRTIDASVDQLLAVLPAPGALAWVRHSESHYFGG